MQRKLILVICVVLSSIAFSCKESDCGSKSFETKTINIDSCNTVLINTQCIFTIINDSSNFIEIKGNQNIINNTIYNNKNGIITLSKTNNCTCLPTNNKPNIYIHSNSNLSIIANEACSIISNEAFTKDITIDIQALMIDISLNLNNYNTIVTTQAKTGGNIKLYGISLKCKIDAFYTTTTQLSDLVTKTMNVTNGTNNNFTVFASDSLITRNTRMGYIYYKGNPEYTEFKNPEKNIIIE